LTTAHASLCEKYVTCWRWQQERRISGKDGDFPEESGGACTAVHRCRLTGTSVVTATDLRRRLVDRCTVYSRIRTTLQRGSVRISRCLLSSLAVPARSGTLHVQYVRTKWSAAVDRRGLIARSSIGSGLAPRTEGPYLRYVRSMGSSVHCTSVLLPILIDAAYGVVYMAMRVCSAHVLYCAGS
jgi:hypothetical protein